MALKYAMLVCVTCFCSKDFTVTWRSIWILQIQCYHSSGGSLDFIGYVLVGSGWYKNPLNYTGTGGKLSSFEQNV